MASYLRTLVKKSALAKIPTTIFAQGKGHDSASIVTQENLLCAPDLYGQVNG